MSKLFLTSLFLLLAFTCVLHAQNFYEPFDISFSSAGAPETFFQFDNFDSLFADSNIIHKTIYRDILINSWDTTSLSSLYETCSTMTFSGQTSFQPASDNLEWYFRSEGDTVVVSQSPKNVDNLFPVPSYLMADIGIDSVGDNQGGGSNVDITHCYTSYSDDKLYFQMQNAGGGYPTNSGLFTYYVYAIALLDPDASDSLLYMLIYGNVPALLSPGLYTLDRSDSSYINIGAISTNISGNQLNMSCNISDLTAHAGWSTWPPPSGFIGVASLISTQVLTNLTTNDIGKYSLFVPKSNTLDYSSNITPTLSSPTAFTGDGDTVICQVTYQDANDNLPVVRLVNFDGLDYDLTACEKDYAAGSLFENKITVTESGIYDYYFMFSDGLDTVTTNTFQIEVGQQTFIPGDADSSGAVDISDAVYLIGYIFGGGPAPEPLASGDADCSGGIDISDAVYLIAYIFGGGPTPVECI